MNLRHPIQDLIPGVRGVVVELLAQTSQPLTGNQLAALSGGRVSQSSVSRAVSGLEQSGLVNAWPAGRAVLYELNRDHVLAEAVLRAVSARATLLGRISALVERWEPSPRAVWLFGSAAREQTREASDVDLLVVGDDHGDERSWSEQLARLAESVRMWSGNDCELLEYTQPELRELGSAGDPLITSLRRDAIVIFGARPRDVLRTQADQR